MKRLLFPLLLSIPLCAVDMQPGMDFSLNKEKHLVINNRVLLKINNRPLSVMDVVRKMDMIFYQQYPQYANSEEIKYQFYVQSWDAILASMIDDQLILADAKDKKITATEGEVREALEKIFGGDLVMQLNELGVTYDEAFEMVKTDLIVQKLTGGMVHAKAATAVNPKKVRQLYDQLMKENPPQNRYVYRVLSFRGSQEKESKEVALRAHELLTEGKVALELIPEKFEESAVKIALSAEYSRTDKDISAAHKAVLSKLSPGELSMPVMRKGVVYLFLLDQLENEGPPSFHEMEDELKKKILEKEVIEYNEKYRKSLRKRYGLSDKHLSSLIPEDLQPFAMR